MYCPFYVVALKPPVPALGPSVRQSGSMCHGFFTGRRYAVKLVESGGKFIPCPLPFLGALAPVEQPGGPFCARRRRPPQFLGGRAILCAATQAPFGQRRQSILPTQFGALVAQLARELGGGLSRHRVGVHRAGPLSLPGGIFVASRQIVGLHALRQFQRAPPPRGPGRRPDPPGGVRKSCGPGGQNSACALASSWLMRRMDCSTAGLSNHDASGRRRYSR